MALCEGPITGIGRIWADGKDYDLAGVTWRVHPGGEDAGARRLIAAKEGADNAPAYRGTAYVVFEELPLDASATACRSSPSRCSAGAGGAEGAVRAVTMIPAAGEFAYATEIVTSRDAAGARRRAENVNASAVRSDWSVSLDQLQPTCRNLEAASLVVAWFGDDLRAGHCEIRPGVEVATRRPSPTPGRWAGSTRRTPIWSAADGEARPMAARRPTSRWCRRSRS